MEDKSSHLKRHGFYPKREANFLLRLFLSSKVRNSEQGQLITQLRHGCRTSEQVAQRGIS
jgi:hypothetical protein